MHASRGRLNFDSKSNAWFTLARCCGRVGHRLQHARRWMRGSTSTIRPTNCWSFSLTEGEAAIEPGLSTKLEYPPGEYYFLVKSGERVLLDEGKVRDIRTASLPGRNYC